MTKKLDKKYFENVLFSWKIYFEPVWLSENKIIEQLLSKPLFILLMVSIAVDISAIKRVTGTKDKHEKNWLWDLIIHALWVKNSLLQSYKSQLRTYQQWSCVTVGSREAQPGRWPQVTVLQQRSAYETQVSSQKTSNVSLKEKRSNTADRACQEETFSLMPTARNNQWHYYLDEIPLLKAHKF